MGITWEYPPPAAPPIGTQYENMDYFNVYVENMYKEYSLNNILYIYVILPIY